jgi:uncharacterized membrane protein
VNNRFGFLGMEVTQAEIISSLLFILGIAIILWFGKRHQNASKILKP